MTYLEGKTAQSDIGSTPRHMASKPAISDKEWGNVDPIE